MTAGTTTLSPDRIAALREHYPRAFAPTPRERLTHWGLWLGGTGLTVYSLILFEFSPVRLWGGLDQLGVVVRQMVPPTSGDALGEILWAALETLSMAFIGTLIAAVVAMPFGFLAAKNTFPFMLPRFGVRRLMDGLRGIDQMIWALVFVRAVGLGPLAGIMAIAVSDIGTLAKLFSESIENIERKQVDGVRAVGANATQALRFAIVPQILPMFLSSVLYLFESNVRSATVLGIVGAGGIGFQLSDRIRAHHWEEAAFILILILVMVACIDWLSKRLRSRLIGSV